MRLEQFIKEYDKESSIVLLEGKRNVLPEDETKLTALGELLASRTAKMIFRSGNAEGADHFFSLGVTSIDNKRLQVITPYDGHRQKNNYAYATFSLDKVDLAAETDVVYQSKNNKRAERLIDQYVSGERNRFSVKSGLYPSRHPQSDWHRQDKTSLIWHIL